MKCLPTLTGALLCLSAARPAAAQFSLSATGGTLNATYSSLAATFAAINSGTHTGAITISVTASSNEGTTECVLNPSGVTVGATTASYSSVLIKPAPSVTAQISGAVGNGAAVIRLNGADNVTIDGSNTAGGTTRDLTITNNYNTMASNAVVWLKPYGTADGANNNVIKNCRIQGFNINYYYTAAALACGNAVSAYPTVAQNTVAANSGNLFQNNELRFAQTGILLTGFNTSPYDASNTISGNFLGWLTWRGIYASYQTGLSISSNTISRVVMDDAVHACGIYLGQTASGTVDANQINTILNLNTTTFNGCAGIYSTNTLAGGSVTLSNNFIRSVAAKNTQAMSPTSIGNGISLTGSSAVRLYHNTVSIDSNLNAAANSAALYLNTSATAVTASNNIFYNNSGSTGSRYAVYSAAPNVSTNYNDYYSSGSLGYLGGVRATLADWRSATGSDLNSISVAPVFVSATDLHLAGSGNSALAGAGSSPATVATDVDGQLRPTPPAIGADELVAPLPLLLLDFSANAVAGGNRLRWEWAGTVRAMQFHVERSTNGQSFSEIGGLKPNSAICGFLDGTAPSGRCWYRLRMEEENASSYSWLVTAGGKTADLRVWPNPVCGNSLHLSVPQTAGRIYLYTAAGLLLQEKATSGGEEQIDVSGLPSGQYLLKFQPAEGNAAVIQLSR